MHLFIFYPLRDSETQHENIKEELLNVKPAAETTIEPVSHQTKQRETIEMVGLCRKHEFLMSSIKFSSLSVSNNLVQLGGKN